MDKFYKNAFANQLGDKILSNQRIVKNATCPQKIYKYRPLNEYTLNLFSSSSIYHANIDSFNDPNDGINNYYVEYTPEDVVDFCKKLSKNKGEVLHEEIDFFINHPDKFQELIQMLLNGDMKKYGISCFTTKHDNFLMWSHYANNHTGVCIEFNFYSELLDNHASGNSISVEDYHFFFIRKVLYSDEVPKIKYENAIKEKFTPMYFKSSNWKYEEEFRSIRPKIGTYPFKKSCIRTVFFGTETKDEKIEEIVNLLNQLNYPNTEFYKMKKQIGSYDLITEKIE